MRRSRRRGRTGAFQFARHNVPRRSRGVLPPQPAAGYKSTWPAILAGSGLSSTSVAPGRVARQPPAVRGTSGELPRNAPRAARACDPRSTGSGGVVPPGSAAGCGLQINLASDPGGSGQLDVCRPRAMCTAASPTRCTTGEFPRNAPGRPGPATHGRPAQAGCAPGLRSRLRAINQLGQ